MNETAIIIPAQICMVNFCFNGRDLVCIYSDRYLWYRFVPWNHLLNLSELLVKQYKANSKNGVVGNTGSIVPNAPRENAIIPIVTKRAFFNDVVLLYWNSEILFIDLFYPFHTMINHNILCFCLKLPILKINNLWYFPKCNLSIQVSMC